MGSEKIINMLNELSSKENVPAEDIDRVYNFIYGYTYAGTRMIEIGNVSSDKDLMNFLEETSYFQGMLMGLKERGLMGSEPMYRELIHVMDDAIGTAKSKLHQKEEN